MSTTNFGTVTGTIVSDIKERVINTLKIVEFRIKPIGASDDDSPLPMVAYNGIGQNMLKRYNKGDTVTVTHRLRYSTWMNEDNEPRGRYEVIVTSFQTIRLGRISAAQRQQQREEREEQQQNAQAEAAV